MKRFSGNYLLLSIVVSLVFFACEKEYNTRECSAVSTVQCAQLPLDSTLINVKIKNNTGYPLCGLSAIIDPNSLEEVKYGEVGEGEEVCYTTYASPRFYPEIFFQLGTANFHIPDTLVNGNYPYAAMRITDPGFWSYNLFLPQGLDTNIVQTSVSFNF